MAELEPLVPEKMNPPLNITMVKCDADLPILQDFFRRNKRFVIDVETNLVDHFWQRKIRTIQVGTREEQIVVDLLGFAKSKDVMDVCQGEYGANADIFFGRLVNVLAPVLESTEWVKIGHNLKFDYCCIKFCLGIDMYTMHDTMIAEQMRYAGLVPFGTRGFFTLHGLVERYMGRDLSKDEQCGFDLETPLTDSQIAYCALDARVPFNIAAAQWAFLEEDGQAFIAEIEFAAIPSCGDIELNGMLIDKEVWQGAIDATIEKRTKVLAALDRIFIPVVGSKHINEQDKDKLWALENEWRNETDKVTRAENRKRFIAYRQDVSKRQKMCDSCIGEAAVNYRAPAQLAAALIAVGVKKKSLPSTGDEILYSLASDEFKDMNTDKVFKNCPELDRLTVIDLIRCMRELEKKMSQYGEMWVKTGEFVDFLGEKKNGLISEYDGRIHPNFNQIGAATGLPSCTSPNLLNIVRGSIYRSAFIARKGFKLATVDMAGAELRIIAEMSGDPVWLNAFNSGWDVHSVCAHIIFGKEWDDATEEGCKFASEHDKCKCKKHAELRQIAKSLNFGLAFFNIRAFIQ